MAVTVIRNTNWAGMASPVIIKVDNEVVGKVQAGQQVEIDILNDQASMSVSQSWAKSSNINVENGDTIEITSTRESILFRLFPYIAIFLTFFIFNNSNQLIVYIIIMIVYFINSLFIKLFRLKKIE